MTVGTARRLNFDDLEIEGSSYDEDADTPLPEYSEDESDTDTSVMDIPYGHTTMQANALVQQLPRRGKVGLINDMVIEKQ